MQTIIHWDPVAQNPDGAGACSLPPWGSLGITLKRPGELGFSSFLLACLLHLHGPLFPSEKINDFGGVVNDHFNPFT